VVTFQLASIYLNLVVIDICLHFSKLKLPLKRPTLMTGQNKQRNVKNTYILMNADVTTGI